MRKIARVFQLLIRRKWITLIVVLVAIILWRFVFVAGNGEVITAQVEKGRVTDDLVLLGSIQADEHAQLFFPVSGELVWLGVSEGENVKRGQLLARLDQAALNAAYEIALADYRAATATLERVYDQIQGRDKDESFALRETRVAAESAKDKSYRALSIAQKNMTQATLRAPFDGIVTRITHPYANINTSIAEGQMEIVNPKTLYFRVNADQVEIKNISVGQKVEIILDAFEDRAFGGSVDFISFTPRVGELGTVYGVKVRLDEGIMDNIRVGMTGDAKFILEEKNDTYFLPPRFIKTDSGGRFINTGRRNNKVYIKVGIEGEDRVEVIGDFKEGDVVYY
jgi:RND family efflux transporter MFP subunit